MSPLRLSSLLLVAANVVPLVGVLAWGWSAFDVVLLYWFENVIVGFYNALRILSFSPRENAGAAWLSKLFFTPFFCVHYGGFCLVHGVFVVSLFGEGSVGGPGDMIGVGFHEAGGSLAPALLALFLSHGVSFFVNYIGGGEFRVGEIGEKMMAPYGRIVVLHLAVLFGAFATQALGNPMPILVLLVIGKIALDVHFHLRSHRKREGGDR